jgi:hypothetical protein
MVGDKSAKLDQQAGSASWISKLDQQAGEFD